jgi:hypothetical protein
VSDRLDSLAEQHTLVSEALVTISGSVRNTATLFGGAGCDKNSPLRRTKPSKCLIADSLYVVYLWPRKLVVQHDVEKRTVNLQAFAVVVDEA